MLKESCSASDVTNLATWNKLEYWIEQIKNNSNEDIEVILIANKTDLVDQRVVTSDTAKDKATELNWL
eukprot:CAMPEP_0116917490 /NCGR_PEP_ID=MMETSP0467-20121206/19174_1 /TAXON_ID=283647 /ORGANISM="Mesodinium pulex, Strain SPMC105" /LENGTH=67 /DNA_ID=CAMNT_0004594593 /DNA_START=235 /DNA_END=437 /DNA_ORIENTATION=-